MNYKEVFQLAESKGYKPIICFIAKYAGSATLPRDVTDAAKELCEITLIQKWLRDTHGIITEPQFCSQDGKFYCKNYNTNRPFAYLMSMSTLSEDFKNGFDSYHTALLNGIIEALKLLNKTT